MVLFANRHDCGGPTVSAIAIQIAPDAVYDDDILFALLGVTSRTLIRARQAKQLRYTHKGQRVLYLGRWVLDWLAADDTVVATGKAVAHAE
jgi:hypothetical protein